MRVMGLDGCSPWKPSHWAAVFGMWRGRRRLHKIKSERDIKQAVRIFTKAAGQHVMWSQAAGLIEGFYFVWMNHLDEMKALAEERGKLPAMMFADELTKALQKHFREIDDGSEEVR